MKFCRKIVLTLLLLLSVAVVSYAQTSDSDSLKHSKHSSSIFRFGIKGGMNFSRIDFTKPGDITISENMNSHTGFNAGVAFSFKLPVKGMTIQPEINYVSKGAKIKGDKNINIRMDYIEIPVNLQIGLDLILLRPFIMVSPYIGYSVYKQWSCADYPDINTNMQWKYLNRFEYGIGVGGGIDVWRVQIQAKYNWNLGKLLPEVPTNVVTDTYTKAIFDGIGNGNFRGFEISVTFLF